MIHAHYLLFVGRPGRSARLAEDRLREFASRVHGDDVEVDVVLVEERPMLAEQHGVLATPMIVRALPLPSLRLIGLPDDVEQLAQVFDEMAAMQQPAAGGAEDPSVLADRGTRP